MDDRTEKDKTKNRCREDDLKYSILFDQSPDGILLIDTEGKFLDFNTEAHRRLGYSREEFAKLRLQDIEPVESPEEIRMRILKILNERKAEFEVRHKTRNGEIRDVQVITQVISLSGRQVFHSIWHDITERKKTEDALREANTRLETLIHAMPDMVILKDVDGRYVLVNDTVEECTGRKQEEFIGKTNNELLPPDIAEMCNRSDAEAIQRGRPIHAEEQSFDKEGSVQFLDTIKAPIHDSKGRLTGLLCVARDITEHKKAEEALQRSEDKFRTLFEFATDGLFVIDTEGYVIDVNKTAYERLGYTKEEMLSMHVSRLDHPDFRETIPERMEHLHKYGWCVCESAHLKKDGTVMPVEINARVMDYDGKKVFFSVIRDITERKKAEEALRQSEERFRLAMLGATDGLWDWNLKTDEVYYSPRWKSMLGYSEEELEHHLDTWKRLVHPDDKESTLLVVREVLEGRANNYRGEFRMRHKDGHYCDILSRAFLVHDAYGVPLRLVGTHVDITDRKEAEEKIRHSEEFIRNILDTVDEGFIVIDRDFRILTANKAYCSQAGGNWTDIIGRHCYEISHKTRRPCYEEGEECAVRHVFETGESHTSLHKHQDAKGSILYVETKAFPIKDSTGVVTSVIETVNNITERHLLEKEQLKTQKLEAIGTLAGGIAHDFNNLLQGVFGYISMAKRMHDQKQNSLDMLEQAEKALQMSVNLTSQLLTFSKGGKPLPKRIALRPVIENSVKFALSGSRVDYRIQVDEQIWMVEADEGQIGQVIQNLVLNAEQAMPMGGTITITAKNVSLLQQGLPPVLQQGNYVVISIKDSGIGIPEQYLPKIFDPYFTTKDKGSGLGLATSYSIIKNHGGLIDVKSKLGEGTTFFVYLPAVEAVETSAVTVSEDVKALRKGRILLMDDEDIVRDIAGVMIRSLDHEVELAEDGEEAIAKYRESMKTGRQFDIVIMDLTIRGGMGGEEAIKELREIDPHIKAIVSSGYTDSSAISEYKTIGFQTYLTKPYDIDLLNTTLNSLLD